jgi:hypothetical protein
MLSLAFNLCSKTVTAPSYDMSHETDVAGSLLTKHLSHASFEHSSELKRLL